MTFEPGDPDQITLRSEDKMRLASKMPWERWRLYKRLLPVRKGGEQPPLVLRGECSTRAAAEAWIRGETPAGFIEAKP